MKLKQVVDVFKNSVTKLLNEDVAYVCLTYLLAYDKWVFEFDIQTWWIQ